MSVVIKFRKNLSLLFFTLLLFLGTTKLTWCDESPMMQKMRNGTIVEKTEAMYHLGYAGNKKPFWLYVKYLNFHPQTEHDSITAIQCREAAATALGRIKDKRAAPYLIEQWKREKAVTVKIKIISSLRYYKNSEIEAVIREGMKAEETNLVFESVITAGYYKSNALIADLESLYSSTKDDTIKAAASFSIIETDPKLSKYIQHLEASLTSENSSERYWAAFFIGESEKTEALSALKRALEIEHQPTVAKVMNNAITRLHYVLKRQERLRRYNKYEYFIN